MIFHILKHYFFGKTICNIPTKRVFGPAKNHQNGCSEVSQCNWGVPMDNKYACDHNDFVHYWAIAKAGISKLGIMIFRTSLIVLARRKFCCPL